MSESSAKKPKLSVYKGKRKAKYALEPGQKGFLATCNFREKDCIRDCYNILNEYTAKFYGVTEDLNKSNTEITEISEDLDKEISALNEKAKSRTYQNVDTGTANCLFIQSNIEDPVDLGVRIMRDIQKNKIHRSRFILRFVPISTVCRANIASIMESAGKLFDEHFLKGNVTYCIIFNKRYNNVVDRMEIISNLAELIKEKNPTNKVDLKNAEQFVIVEIIKGICLMSVVPDYFLLKKYNIAEISKTLEEESEIKDTEIQKEEVELENEDTEIKEKDTKIEDKNANIENKEGIFDELKKQGNLNKNY